MSFISLTYQQRVLENQQLKQFLAWGLPGSVVLHLLVGGGFLGYILQRPIVSFPEEAVEITLVDMEEEENLELPDLDNVTLAPQEDPLVPIDPNIAEEEVLEEEPLGMESDTTLTFSPQSSFPIDSASSPPPEKQTEAPPDVKGSESSASLHPSAPSPGPPEHKAVQEEPAVQDSKPQNKPLAKLEKPDSYESKNQPEAPQHTQPHQSSALHKPDESSSASTSKKQKAAEKPKKKNAKGVTPAQVNSSQAKPKSGTGTTSSSDFKSKTKSRTVTQSPQVAVNPYQAGKKKGSDQSNPDKKNQSATRSSTQKSLSTSGNKRRGVGYTKDKNTKVTAGLSERFLPVFDENGKLIDLVLERSTGDLELDAAIEQDKEQFFKKVKKQLEALPPSDRGKAVKLKFEQNDLSASEKAQAEKNRQLSTQREQERQVAKQAQPKNSSPISGFGVDVPPQEEISSPQIQTLPEDAFKPSIVPTSSPEPTASPPTESGIPLEPTVSPEPTASPAIGGTNPADLPQDQQDLEVPKGLTSEPSASPKVTPPSKPSPEATYESPPEPAYEPFPEPTDEASPEPAYEPFPEPAYEVPSEPAYEPSLEPAYEAPSEPVYEPSAEPTLEPPPEPAYKPLPSEE